MSQYFPTKKVLHLSDLNRTISKGDYELVLNAFHESGFSRGWIQDMDSNASYRT